MGFDQNITYRVNVDDSNFQAKLTQMRASLDASMGGMSGAGGGMTPNMMYGMMGAMSGGGFGGGGGYADFGSQIRPVTYTPPAIAMTPHFGMYQVSQTLAQAGLATMGVGGVAVSGAMTNFARGGIGGLFMGRGAVPENITMAEYMAMSARGFGDRAGDAAAIGAVTIASTAGQLAAGGLGAAAGAALFSPGGIMAGVGGFVGGMVGAQVVSAYAGAVTDMMADNRAIQTSLAAGSFRFFTGGGADIDQLTGRGMSRRARAGTAKSIQAMEQNDLRYGIDEYKDILEGGMQLDLFSGTRDVEDFKTKFKGLVENLKTVTSTLHTSLKEGLEVVRGFRDMGVTDPTEVNRLVLGSEMRGRMSGRTGMEMMALGQAGAEIFRGTGIAMERGFELNQINTTSIRSMLNAGTLSREMISQAGGENALAQQMTAGALSAFQTPQGRAAMMSGFNMSTGTLNLSNLGNQGLMQQVAGAAAMGPGALLTFQARQEDLISTMSPEQMQLFGGKLDIAMAKDLMKFAPGLGSMDAIRVAAQRRGMSKAQIETEISTLTQDPEKVRAEGEQAISTMRQQASLEDVRNRFNVGKRVSNFLRRTFVAPVSNMAMDLSTSVGAAVEDTVLSLEGVNRVDPALIGNKVTARAEEMVGNADRGEAVNIGGSLYQRLVGGQTGQAFIDEMEATGGGRIVKDEAAARALGRGFSYGKDSKGNFIAMENAKIEDMRGKARSMQATGADMEAVGKLDVKSDAGLSIGARIMQLGEGAQLSSVMRVATGVSLDEMQSMGDVAFAKKYGHDKGYFSALTEKYFNTYGSKQPKVVEQLARLTGTTTKGDALATTQSGLADQANDAANQVLDEARDTGTIQSREQMDVLRQRHELIPLLFGKDQTKSRALLKAETGMDFGDVIAKAQSGSSQKVKTAAATLKGSIEELNRMRSAEGTQTEGASKVAGGDISKDTEANFVKQAAELKSIYQELIGLHETLNRMKGRGR